MAKYMHELGLDARLKKKYRVVTTDSEHSLPIADRLFKIEDHQTLPTGPGEVLAGDITYLKLGDSYLYLAVVIDLYTRAVVGWSMQSCLHTKLVLDAMAAAMAKVGPDAQIIFHSDRGSQYASEAYRNFAVQMEYYQACQGGETVMIMPMLSHDLGDLKRSGYIGAHIVVKANYAPLSLIILKSGTTVDEDILH